MAEGVKRKISAILSADVVGYSKLMEADEETTVRTIGTYRETISSIIEQHNGRVVDSPGDNILSEFPSVVESVQCAVEIQHVIKAKNAVIPEARRMVFRIGIHLGDVIEEKERIYGDGVNIAARVEGIADAGGICISESAYQQIKSKLMLGYEDLGEHTVKNISDPVKVFRVPIDSTDAGASVKSKRSKWFQLVALALICIALGAGVVSVWNQMQKTQNVSSIAKEELAIPADKEAKAVAEKPSVAVLPFDNMSGDPEQSFFGDGMADEIINGLAKNTGLVVKGRASSFSDKVRNQDIKTVAELLNVTHVVEGSVRKSNDRIRIIVQLIDTAVDAHVWSGKYDRKMTDVFEIQDEISGEILKALNIHLIGSDKRQIRIGNLEAYDAYLLGCYQADRHQLDEAIVSFKKAIALEPDFADAYAKLARTYMLYIWWQAKSPRSLLPMIRENLNKALVLDPESGESLSLRILMQVQQNHTYQDGINELDSLLRKYPSNTSLLDTYEMIMKMIDQTDLALKINDQKLTLDPLSAETHLDRGILLIRSSRFKKAKESFAKVEALGSAGAILFASAALEDGDTVALQEQLDRGQSEWGSLGGQYYAFYKAANAYLKGDYKAVKKVLSQRETDKSYVSFMHKGMFAQLEGDLDLALDHYSQALLELEFGAFRDLFCPFHYRVFFPDYRSHPKYQKILHDYGLDEESIAKLKIPPLPF